MNSKRLDKYTAADNFPNGSASVLLVRDSERILAVSRKLDHSDLGLPGGKIEPGESPISAACREAVEEIGRPICNPRLIDVALVSNIYVFIFTADALGEVRDHINSEGAAVRWVKPEQICSGSFGKFNKKFILPLI